jgi:hypothetical protein
MGAWEHGRVENEERAFRGTGVPPVFYVLTHGRFSPCLLIFIHGWDSRATF